MTGILAGWPDGLRAAVSGEASRRGVTEAEWLEEAAREKLAADAELAYLAARAGRADRAAYGALLERVPDAPPMPGDGR